MEQQNISLSKGIRRAPSLGEDGELTECIGVVPGVGGLKNIAPAKEIGVTLAEGDKLMCVHTIAQTGQVHYVFTRKNSSNKYELRYAGSTGSISDAVVTYDVEPSCVKVIGNTLVVMLSSGMEYVLWRNGSYKSLGSMPPETNIEFGLTTEVGFVGADDAAVLWMIEKQSGGTWNGPIRVTGETTQSSFSKVYVFKKKNGDKPAAPTSSELLPDGWYDAPNSTYNTYMCIGEVSNGKVTSWGNVIEVAEKYYYGLKSMDKSNNQSTYYFTLGGTTAPNPDLSTSAVPTGWKNYAIPTQSSAAMAKFSNKYQDAYEQLSNGGRDRMEISATYMDSGNVSDVAGDVNSFTASVMGTVNKWVADAKKEGQFCYPFFVRYAYRMFDGSHIMHSAPVLMIPNSSGRPFVLSTSCGTTESAKGIRYYVGGPKSKLVVTSLSCGSGLDDWKDIITGVDIYVSSQFYNYNPSGEVKSLSLSRNNDFLKNAYTESKVPSQTDYVRIGLFNDEVAGAVFPDKLNDEGKIASYTGKLPNIAIDLPSLSASDEALSQQDRKETETFAKKVVSCGSFYLFKSYEIDNDKEKLAVGSIDIEDGVLSALEAREHMDDDFFSHEKKDAVSAYVYNNRLNLAGVRRRLYDGYDLRSIRPKVEKVAFSNDASPWGNVTTNVSVENIKAIYYYIKDEAKGDIIVKKEYSSGIAMPMFLYYPNPKAYKAIIKRETTTTTITSTNYYSVQLKEHSALNGAYWFAEMDESNAPVLVRAEINGAVDSTFSSPIAVPVASSYACVELPHSIYQSNVNNPFKFPAKGVNEVGTGDIMSVSTSTKALSQGQFGQFPLYAFCSDGIWAMEIAQDGNYSSVHPVSRDVCSNVDSIVQVDDAVIFATMQGLKVLSGSETRLLSEAMDGKNDGARFVQDAVNKSRRIGLYDSYKDMTVVNTLDFVTLLMSSKIVYDYINRHLHIYFGSTKHYVYSLSQSEFATYIGNDSKVVAVVPGYPYSTMQLSSGKLVQFQKQNDQTTRRKGLVVTRPISFGDPMGMKLLADMRLAYSKTTPATKCYVTKFVSNDRLNWMPLASLRAHSYKWYRFAILTDMTDADTLEGMTCLIERRRTNKLR